MKLRQALLGCPSGLLRRIAAHHGQALDVATLPAELVERLASHLERAAGTGELWRGLGPDERAAVGLVARAGGRQGTDLLERRLAGRGIEPNAILAGLVESGVLFRVFETGTPTRGASYLLPEEHLGAARELVAATSTPDWAAAEVEPVETRENDPILDCFILASALRRETWNLAGRSVAGKPRRSAEQVLAGLRPAMVDVDGSLGRGRWRFFLRTGRRIGWLSGSRWPIPDDRAVQELLDGRLAAIRRLWSAYLGMDGAGGARAIADWSGRPGSTLGFSRADVLQLLAEAPAGRWYRCAALVEAIARELDLPSHRGGSPAGRPGVVPPTARRPDAVGELRRWLAGAWYWLGLVRWGRDASGWALVSTTPTLSAVVTGSDPSAGPAACEPCHLDEELRLSAPRTADLGALYRAERYLSYAGTGPERRYRLTASSFARGVRLGGSMAEARELLETLGQAALPLPWLEALRSWGAMVGQVRLDARIVLSAADEEVLRRVAEVPGLLESVDEQLSGHHLSIAPHRLERVAESLAEAGWPVETGAGLRLEPTRPDRAAGLRGDAASVLWVLLEALDLIDPALVRDVAGAATVRAALEAVIPSTARPALERRAAALAERITDRRRPPAWARREADSMV